MNKANLIEFGSGFFVLLILSSCSSIGLLSEENSWLTNDIESVGDFFGVYFVLQISIIIVSLILSFFFGKGGNSISLIAHFIWIVSYRDYGFWLVLLLFSLFSIVSFIIKIFFVAKRNY